MFKVSQRKFLKINNFIGSSVMWQLKCDTIGTYNSANTLYLLFYRTTLYDTKGMDKCNQVNLKFPLCRDDRWLLCFIINLFNMGSAVTVGPGALLSKHKIRTGRFPTMYDLQGLVSTEVSN